MFTLANRLELHAKFEEILGSENVYFQPPATLKMHYDAIRYSMKDIENVHADNLKYNQNDCYEGVVIYRDPDSDLPRKISQLPKCSIDRFYTKDNLNHAAFTIYH